VVTATGEAVGGEHKDLPTIADLLAPATSSKPESTDFSEIVRPPFTGVPAVSAPPPQKFNVINVTALLIALAALVLVLLFPARAQVPAHSISGTQIKLGSITNNDLASGNISTGPAGANGAPGPRGPSGPTGAAGATGAASGLERVTYVSQNVANVSGTQSATANCSSSLKVIGGGATISGDGVVLTTSTVASNGWSATATPLPSSTNNTSIKYTLTVTAVCAQVKTSG
jgi:hypothetical protein